MHMGTKLDSIHDMNFGLGIAIKKSTEKIGIKDYY